MLTVLLLTLLTITAHSKTQPTNFDYDEHGLNWQDQCSANGRVQNYLGTKQSPIELSQENVQKNKDTYLFGDYGNTTGTVNFLNTTVYINTSNTFGSVYTKVIEGTSMPFKANQIRLRMHAQHSINKKFNDLEMQIFHQELYQSKNLKFALSIMFQVGETANKFLQTIIDAYDSKTTQINFNLNEMIAINLIDDFWFYTGSVTIPPCTNGKLSWVVVKRQYSFTKQQKNKLQLILSQGRQNWPGNYRMIQNSEKNVIGYKINGE